MKQNSSHQHIIDTFVPKPSAKFKQELHTKLRIAHAEFLSAPKRHAIRWQWMLSLPVVAVVVLSIFVTSTFGPALSPEQFLQRAYAAAVELKAKGLIEYSKIREVRITEPNRDKDPLGPAVLVSSFIPHIQEQWYAESNNLYFFRYKTSLDNGDILTDEILQYSDPEMLIPDKKWILIADKNPEKLPICVNGAYSEEPMEPFTDEEKKVLSGSLIGGSEESNNLYYLISDKDPVIRLDAITTLQKKGVLADLGTSKKQGRTIRTFRVYLTTSSYDDDGKAILYPDSIAILLSFDASNFSLVKEEWYDVDDDKTLGDLWTRTEYVEQKYIDEPVETLFNPLRYGLTDLWTLAPFPKKDFESKKVKEGCFHNKKYLGEGMFSVFDILGEDAYDKKIDLQFNNKLELD